MENFHILGFFETNRSVGAHPPKNVQVFLQILNPVKNAAILAPELLGGQIRMVVSQFCHTFFMLMW